MPSCRRLQVCSRPFRKLAGHVNSPLCVKLHTFIRYWAVKESPTGFWNRLLVWHRASAKCNIHIQPDVEFFLMLFIWKWFAKIIFFPFTEPIARCKVSRLDVNLSLLYTECSLAFIVPNYSYFWMSFFTWITIQWTDLKFGDHLKTMTVMAFAVLSSSILLRTLSPILFFVNTSVMHNSSWKQIKLAFSFTVREKSLKSDLSQHK